MADISKINVNNTTYNIKAAEQDPAIGYLATRGAKNLMPQTLKIGSNSSNASPVYTGSNVRFTANSDGSITVERLSGNSSVNVWLYNDDGAILLDDYADGTNWFVTGITGGHNISMRLAKLGTDGGYLSVTEYITIPSKGSYTGINVSISVGTDFTGSITLKPMVQKKMIEDRTFVPYAPTNRQLYEQLQALAARVAILEANL